MDYRPEYRPLLQKECTRLRLAFNDCHAQRRQRQRRRNRPVEKRGWRQTFTRERDMEYSYVCDGNGSRIKIGDGSLYADEEHDVILYIGNDAFWEKNALKALKGAIYRITVCPMTTAIAGRKKFIITEGMTPQNPIPDVVYGRNMTLSCQPVIIRSADGALLVGIHPNRQRKRSACRAFGISLFKAVRSRSLERKRILLVIRSICHAVADISSRGVLAHVRKARKRRYDDHAFQQLPFYGYHDPL